MQSGSYLIPCLSDDIRLVPMATHFGRTAPRRCRTYTVQFGRLSITFERYLVEPYDSSLQLDGKSFVTVHVEPNTVVARNSALPSGDGSDVDGNLKSSLA